MLNFGVKEYLNFSEALGVAMEPEKEYRYFVKHSLGNDEVVPEHKHPSYSEIIIIENGAFVLAINGEKRFYNNTDGKVFVITIPNGIIHSFYAIKAMEYYVLRRKKDNIVFIN